MAKLIGNAPNQVPTNADLGKMAFEDKVSVANINATGTKDATTFLRVDNTFAEAGGGITEADAWRINVNTVFSSSGQSDVTANWERTHGAGFDKIGTGLTESSGIFSFPSTGYYYINHFSSTTAGAARQYTSMMLKITVNNSTYYTATSNYANIASASYLSNNSASFIVRVTDISNIKFKFEAQRSDTFTLLGSTSESRSGFSCIRLGDI